LDEAFHRYEAAVREHAFVHAAVTHRICAGEVPRRSEIDAVDGARRRLDEARSALSAIVDF
jgi:hypothetical protein